MNPVDWKTIANLRSDLAAAKAELAQMTAAYDDVHKCYRALLEDKIIPRTTSVTTIKTPENFIKDIRPYLVQLFDRTRYGREIEADILEVARIYIL